MSGRQAEKLLLFDEKIPWTKKGNSHFDVGMGSLDGAETCNLLGIFLLSKLADMNINLGLYRNDGCVDKHKLYNYIIK